MAKVKKQSTGSEGVLPSSEILLQMKRSMSQQQLDVAEFRFKRVIQCIRENSIKVEIQDIEFTNQMKIQILKGLIC